MAGISTYARSVNAKATPSNKPIPGRNMVPNEAGGYGFELDPWDRLDRFLILGTSGGTYYVKEEKHTDNNVQAVRDALAIDGQRVVQRIVELSDAGRAFKQDPAIFALGLALKTGDDITRKAAKFAVPLVCRTSTHLFSLAEVVEALGGWGRGTRSAFAEWYAKKADDQLAYQLVKYRQREGWTHRDILRLSHPSPNALLRWAVGKDAEVFPARIIQGYERARVAKTPEETAALVLEYRLPREAVKTEHVNTLPVQEALLNGMPMHALVRNLGNLTKSGLLAVGSDATKKVLDQLGNVTALKKSRLHPMAVLIAQRVYASGQGFKGKGNWVPVPRIIDALDAAFYSTFANVEPTGRTICVGIDVSGSMGGGYGGGTLPGGMAVYEAATAMAMVILATEPNSVAMGFDNDMYDLSLSGKQRLDDALKYMRERCRGGSTNCALPYAWVLKNGIKADTFITITDNEHWVGTSHPTQALVAYRGMKPTTDHPQYGKRTDSHKGCVPGAKAVVMGMTATGHSIADPLDAGQLNVIGFDASVPEVINQFIRG